MAEELSVHETADLPVLIIDVPLNTVTYGGRSLSLPPHEFALLVHLAASRGRYVLPDEGVRAIGIERPDDAPSAPWMRDRVYKIRKALTNAIDSGVRNSPPVDEIIKTNKTPRYGASLLQGSYALVLPEHQVRLTQRPRCES
jgi:hypothetical protein